MFSEFELPLGFEDCRTRPPREPRAGRDASWNKLERELEQARTDASWNGTRLIGNVSCSCPGCKLRTDGAEAEFV
ncbi:hypothetical protein F2Q69_00021071 [Brassica cretica]|uniref:Uncharacterized protein n=1 Tax=Brassica cretica TaxID=69181 RepID=A0A8S9QNZ8_BRACR|nr:hypothetical protein F2Q69_00021071 [Brassica cretica]